MVKKKTLHSGFLGKLSLTLALILDQFCSLWAFGHSPSSYSLFCRFFTKHKIIVLKPGSHIINIVYAPGGEMSSHGPGDRTSVV